jgi:hypothetical protein
MSRTNRFPKVLLFSAGALMFVPPALADFSQAVFEKTLACAKGSFPDPRKGGECWSCPSGTLRTVFSVTSDQACEKPASSAFAKAALTRQNTRIAQGCPAGQFFDIVGENFGLGACYECPSGYVPTAGSVTSARKCEKVTLATFARATRTSTQERCGPRQFFDPRNGGECWSCPDSTPYRTINHVNGSKACAGKFEDTFAADTDAICRDLIRVIRDFGDGGQKLTADLETFFAPIAEPINKEISKISSQINSPKELDKLFDDISTAMQPVQPALEKISQFGDQTLRNPFTLEDVVLDPELVCGGDKQRIEKALAKAGIDPSTSDHAYHLISVGTLVRPSASNSFGVVLSLSMLTDFRGAFRTFFSLGVGISTSARFEPSVTYMVFPPSDLSLFEGVGNLGMEFSVGPGDAMQRLLSRNGRVASGPAKAPGRPGYPGAAGTAKPTNQPVPQFDKLKQKPGGQYDELSSLPKNQYAPPPQVSQYGSGSGQYQALPKTPPQSQYGPPPQVAQYDKLKQKPGGQYDELSSLPKNQYAPPPQVSQYGTPPNAPQYVPPPRAPQPQYGPPPQVTQYGSVAGQFPALPKTSPPPYSGVEKWLQSSAFLQEQKTSKALKETAYKSDEGYDWISDVCTQLGWCQGGPEIASVSPMGTNPGGDIAADQPAPTKSSSGGITQLPPIFSIVISANPGVISQKGYATGVGLRKSFGTKGAHAKLGGLDLGANVDFTFRLGGQ